MARTAKWINRTCADPRRQASLLAASEPTARFASLSRRRSGRHTIRQCGSRAGARPSRRGLVPAADRTCVCIDVIAKSVEADQLPPCSCLPTNSGTNTDEMGVDPIDGGYRSALRVRSPASAIDVVTSTTSASGLPFQSLCRPFRPVGRRSRRGRRWPDARASRWPTHWA